MVARLAQRLTCLSLDLPGVGDSLPAPEFDYSLESLAKLIRHFVMGKELRNVTLFAHSFGAGIALLSLIQGDTDFSQCVARLCILDGMCYPQRFPLFVAALRAPILSQVVTELLPTRLQALSVLQQCYFDASKITNSQVASYSHTLERPQTRNAVRRMAREIDPDHLSKYLPALKTITIPTLLIWGRHDQIVPLQNGERLARDIPTSELHVLDACGHMPQEECPDLVVELIIAFLNKTNITPAHP
ncbi:alpha/beta hydrolase [Bradyrhizobium sp. B097]|uniref:alpha/beta fold hydrolase n=1 Tax=Bradyrhizobium sp. B097 TaxID=3140244 RepID=UPI0031833970